MKRKEEDAKSAEVIQDISVGFVDEVISDQPYITIEGKILSYHPVLEFGLGKTYQTRGWRSSHKFRVVTSGKKEIGGLGEAYLYYGVEFLEGESTRVGIVEITEYGMASEIRYNPNEFTQVVSDRLAIDIGVCEPVPEEVC